MKICQQKKAAAYSSGNALETDHEIFMSKQHDFMRKFFE
jgi:hypothetical protein